MNRTTRCPMPGLSKIVSLFMIIVTPAATIATADEKNRKAENQSEQSAQDRNEDHRREDDNGNDDFRRREHR